MERSDRRAKVVSLAADALAADAAGLDESTEFKSLGADSFDLLELVTAFEDEFGSTLDDDSLQKIQTLGDAVDAIASALGA